jgi:MFS family permease
MWGLLLGATTPVLMSLISRETGGVRQGYVLGIAQSTTQFASVTGIVLGGWLSEGVGLSYTYFFVAVSYALGMVVILALSRVSAVPSRIRGFPPDKNESPNIQSQPKSP